MSVRSEISRATADMSAALNDPEEWAPLAGGMLGFAGGVAFIVGVEGFDGHNYSRQFPALENQIGHLLKVESELTGTPQAIRKENSNINERITQRWNEIQQDRPHHTPLTEATVEIAAPVLGGMAIGALLFTTAAVRLRLFKQRRAQRRDAASAA